MNQLDSDADPRQQETRGEAIVSAMEATVQRTHTELERTAHEHAESVRGEADAAARELLHDAAASTARYLAECKSIIDDFSADRIVRVSSVSDDMLEQIEVINYRLTQVAVASSELARLLAELGQAAEEIATETYGPGDQPAR